MNLLGMQFLDVPVFTLPGPTHEMIVMEYIFKIIGIVLMVAFYMWPLSIVFEKAGVERWKAFIPVYNRYVMSELTFGMGIYCIFDFIPILNFIFAVVLGIKLANNFGKGTFFGCGIAAIPWIFLPLLAFGGSSYVGTYRGTALIGGYRNSEYSQGGIERNTNLQAGYNDHYFQQNRYPQDEFYQRNENAQGNFYRHDETPQDNFYQQNENAQGNVYQQNESQQSNISLQKEKYRVGGHTNYGTSGSGSYNYVPEFIPNQIGGEYNTDDYFLSDGGNASMTLGLQFQSQGEERHDVKVPAMNEVDSNAYGADFSPHGRTDNFIKAQSGREDNLNRKKTEFGANPLNSQAQVQKERTEERTATTPKVIPQNAQQSKSESENVLSQINDDIPSKTVTPPSDVQSANLETDNNRLREKSKSNDYDELFNNPFSKMQNGFGEGFGTFDRDPFSALSNDELK